MRCDMCGSEEDLFRTDIEGAELAVCKSCSKHGEIIRKIEPERAEKAKAAKKKRVPQRPQIITVVDEDYPVKIKQAREKKGMKQEEVAKALGEKSSVIHHLETGSMEPSIELARKLERFFSIDLVEEYEEEVKTKKKTSSSSKLTIGDMVKVE